MKTEIDLEQSGSNEKNTTLFVSALREAVRQYPHYFYVTGHLDELDSMWDMQPDFRRLEDLMLESVQTQAFIVAVWSFFKPVNLNSVGFADSTRCLAGWQKQLLSQLMIHDPMGQELLQEPILDPEPV